MKKIDLPEYISGIPTAKNWQSTYAVKHLYDIVKKADCDDGATVFFAPKKGTQTKFRYKNIAVLYIASTPFRDHIRNRLFLAAKKQQFFELSSSFKKLKKDATRDIPTLYSLLCTL